MKCPLLRLRARNLSERWDEMRYLKYLLDKANNDRSNSNKTIPIRLEEESYRELMAVKGIMITEKRCNVSFLETVSELVKFFRERKS